MTAIQGKTRPSTTLVWSALASVYLIWGSTYLAIRVAVETLPPLLMSSARFLFAGGLLFVVSTHLGGGKGDPIRPEHWRSGFIVGGALLLGGNGAVVIAEQRLASAHTALLIATVPVWMTVLDRVFFRERLAVAAQAGIAIGFGGIVLLVRPWAAESSLHLPSAFLVLAGSLAWACGSLYARRAPFPRRALLTTGLQMIGGGVLQGVVGLARGELSSVDVAAFSGSSLTALAYLVVFGSLIAYTSYAWLLRNTPTSLAGTYAYVNPVVAVILGAVILNEHVTRLDLLAGLVIVAAVTLIVTARSSFPREEPSGSPADAPPPGVEESR